MPSADVPSWPKRVRDEVRHASGAAEQHAADPASGDQGGEREAAGERPEERLFSAASLRLRGRDSNPNFLVQSQASCR